MEPVPVPVVRPKRAASKSPPPPANDTALPPKRAKHSVSPVAPAAPTSTILTSAIPEFTYTPKVEQPPAPAPAPAPARAAAPVRPAQPKGRSRAVKVKPVKAGGAEETGYFDAVQFFGKEVYDQMKELELGTTVDGVRKEGRNWKKEAELEWGIGAEGKDVEVQIVGISAHGDGLALLTPAGSTTPTRLLTVPFTLPNEVVKAHVHRHEPGTFISHADVLTIVTPSPLRSLEAGETKIEVGKISDELLAVRAKFGERVQCKYFGLCSGCQYQPLSYAAQMELKKTVLTNAFKNFSLLPAASIPTALDTLTSPLEYGYRTKLTPHFQPPPDKSRARNGGGRKGRDGAEEPKADKEWELTIGFEQKGRKRVIDIEECVIATRVINTHLQVERARVQATISTFKRGATLLLRDSLPPRPVGSVRGVDEVYPSQEEHICITDHKATVREQVHSIEFEQMAGSFFQNNNSILPSLISYISSCLVSRPPLAAGVARPEEDKTYLIDAYCGSGLFSIALAGEFDEIEGVEIDKNSILWAKKNGVFNQGEGRGKLAFTAGNAEDIFASIKFPPSRTTILIDPPRKGCDSEFINQLLRFNPAMIIYVSCNVHTQARDVGEVVRRSNEGKEGKGFRIESLRAADLFSQTHHAEGVCVLRRDVE